MTDLTIKGRLTMLAATFTHYAEEMTNRAPVGSTGRLDAMDRREAAVWARAAGMVLALVEPTTTEPMS
jgi:hypothetical protein